MFEEANKHCISKDLIDINDIHIKRDLDKNQRILDYLIQINNPQRYKNLNYIVEVKYTDEGKPIEECIAKIISAFVTEE